MISADTAVSGTAATPVSGAAASHDHHFDATQQEELPEFIRLLSGEFPAHSPAVIAAAVQTCRTTAAPSYGREALMACVRQSLTEGPPAGA